MDLERTLEAAAARPEELLPRLRQLARGLVRSDPELAEDLVQDAWLTALERGGRVGNWRGLLRSLLHRRRRGEARRRRREASAARPDRVVEETGLLVEISERVLELDEPYRTALLLRYLEGLPPREIAARTDAPVATVHSRLERGKAALRERLTSDPEFRRRLLACGPLPWLELPARATSSTALGLGWIMTAKTIGLVALGIGLCLWAGIELSSVERAREVADLEPPQVLEAPGEPRAASRLHELPAAATRTAGDARGTAEDSPADVAVAGAAARGTSPSSEDSAQCVTEATLSGWLVLPDEWQFDAITLQAHTGSLVSSFAAELDPEVEGDHELPFRFTLEPGDTELELVELRYQWRVALPAEGRSDVRLEVPLPATVRVEVRDGQTGEPIADGAVSWRPQTAQEFSSSTFRTLQREGPEPFELRVPEGRIELSFDLWRYESREVELDVLPGLNTFSLDAIPGVLLTLSFVEEDGTPVARHPRVGWSDFDGPGEMLSQGSTGERHQILIGLTEPGTYRVRLGNDGTPGYVAPEPFDVSVGRGEDRVHEVRLRRE